MSSHYFKSDVVLSVQSLFRDHLFMHGVEDFTGTADKDIRKKMFDFFQSKQFLELYFELALSVADNVGLSRVGLILQNQPTPRHFRPGDHGTSFHTDYWYGHGASVYTIWTPLTDLDGGNTFLLCKTDKNDHFFNVLTDRKEFVDIEEQLIADSFPALPPKGSSVVFHSKVLHGSPRNTSAKERISFDFRIGAANDSTSTKDLASYYHWVDNEFTLLRNPFQGKSYLKYICGGHGKNTAAQHIAIEAIAKVYQIRINGQEAEVERFGHIMFTQYLVSLAGKKGFDGIILASKNILSPAEIELSRNSKIDIYCALENEFLNKLA